jgi:hypothetical protein
MNKTNLTIIIFLTLLFLNACSTIAEGLGGGKKQGADEFLVEKKAPLVMPPNFGELPEPDKKIGENQESIKENVLSIKKMIGQNSSVSSNTENNVLNSSVEKSIIKKINESKFKLENLDEAKEKKTKRFKKKTFFQKLREKFN